ncbi:MAG: carboxypeptidase regulatory-like domain-containing protein, partial [Opitutaceae bacterium]
MLTNTLHRLPLRASACRTLLLLLPILLPALLPAQSAGTGAIEGRGFDAGRGEYLEKALISVEGTRLEVLSGETGQYRLANVPAGTVRVKAFFTGLPLQTVTATVTAGQTTT